MGRRDDDPLERHRLHPLDGGSRVVLLERWVGHDEDLPLERLELDLIVPQELSAGPSKTLLQELPNSMVQRNSGLLR